jgi:hypothetical protein
MDRRTLETPSDGAYSVSSFCSVLSRLLAGGLSVLLVRVGAVFGRAFGLLVPSFAAHLSISGHVSGGLLPPPEKLV